MKDKSKSLMPSQDGLVNTGIAVGAGLATTFALNAVQNQFPQVKEFLSKTPGQVVLLAAAGVTHALVLDQKDGVVKTLGQFASFTLAITALKNLMNSGAEAVVIPTDDTGEVKGALGNAMSIIKSGLQSPEGTSNALFGTRRKRKTRRKRSLRGLSSVLEQISPNPSPGALMNIPGDQGALLNANALI